MVAINTAFAAYESLSELGPLPRSPDGLLADATILLAAALGRKAKETRSNCCLAFYEGPQVQQTADPSLKDLQRRLSGRRCTRKNQRAGVQAYELRSSLYPRRA